MKKLSLVLNDYLHIINMEEISDGFLVTITNSYGEVIEEELESFNEALNFLKSNGYLESVIY